MLIVAALYQFKEIPDTEKLKSILLPLMLDAEIKGTLILGKEGINGTVSGSRSSIDKLKTFLLEQGFTSLEYKESLVPENQGTFTKTKVKLKKEICTMGIENIQPEKQKGTYLSPKEWHELIKNPDVIILDTRNDYEFNIGTFKNAINPNIKTFREFPEYLEAHKEEWKDKTIAMFCTGGIRCEKSTSFATMINIGKEVFHLKGGILKYFEEIPQKESLWEGECYVFDHRVSVKHDLSPGGYTLCFACGAGLKPFDIQSPLYENGVSCPHCAHETTEEQKSAYRERMRQIKQGDKGTERFHYTENTKV